MQRATRVTKRELSDFANVNAYRPAAESLLYERCTSDQKSQREYLPRRGEAEVEGEIVAESS